MRLAATHLLGILVLAFLLLPRTGLTTDVDGPNDCQRGLQDFGDAPEGTLAYPGVPGCFPTCMLPGPVGTQQTACPPISTPPGATGFVMHLSGSQGYWLGCLPTGMPLGVDSESDGKVNATGGPGSACNPSISVDCVETAFGLSFGQDECYGTNDAGISTALVFTACASATVPFQTYNCLQSTREVYLNILVDYNQDGDWNDNFLCGLTGPCAYEWAVKNALIMLPPGCTNQVSPAFLVGPNPGNGWLRISLSSAPAPNDFPWAGSANLVGEMLPEGETEDYPVEVLQHGEPCPDYEDWGDAPEEAAKAYPSGVPGHFPTCASTSPPGTQELACPPISTVPGPTGHVRHVATAQDPFSFWLGCPQPGGSSGVDGEPDGKMNDTGVVPSQCNSQVSVDCVEGAFGMAFGQDECYGDVVDAGIALPMLSFKACSTGVVTFDAYNCKTAAAEVYLNILLDYNEDGDWNDNFLCAQQGQCAFEWSVKNALVVLAPGCQTLTSPTFLVGPNGGYGWLRITLTSAPVTDDFPWDGSAGQSGSGYFAGGETEDYPFEIRPADPCEVGYEDFGDAPEDAAPYPNGIPGRFPTCLFATPPGTQEIQCLGPLSLPPGPTGYVRHVATPADPAHVWLGCSLGNPVPMVDGEVDGKTNNTGASQSHCAQLQVDCVEPAYGSAFGQDECTGDGVDAGVLGALAFSRCSLALVPYQAFNCSGHSLEAFLNILVDWNQDADWNDMILCQSSNRCAAEWAVKNAPITLVPGCNPLLSPNFIAGPEEGPAWLRITLTLAPVGDDFPWAGSALLPNGYFEGGETEDYPALVIPSLVGVGDVQAPGEVWLGPVVPNPSRNGVMLRFALPREQEVTLSVYDIAGRRLADLVSGRLGAGEHRVPWDFRDASGVALSPGYFVVKLRAGDQVRTQRGIRMR